MTPQVSSTSEQCAGLSTAENSPSGHAIGMNPNLDSTSRNSFGDSCASSITVVRSGPPEKAATADSAVDATLKRRQSGPTKSSDSMSSIIKSNLTDSEHSPARAVSSPAGLGDSISNSAPTILIRALYCPLQAAPIRSVMSSRTLEESLHRRRDALEGARRRQSRVSFAHVNIREYERVLGDNPSVTSGPPLSIGWRHSTTLLTMSLDDYESGKGSPRSSSEYLVPKSVRETMLVEHAGVSRREIVNTVRIIQKAKAARRKTVVNLGMAPAEERMEETKRKMKTILKPSSSYSCLEAKLWDDAHARAMEKAQTLEESIRRGERVSLGDIWCVGTPSNSILPSRRNSPPIVTRKSPLALSPPSSSSSQAKAATRTAVGGHKGNDLHHVPDQKSNLKTMDHPNTSPVCNHERDIRKSTSDSGVERTTTTEGKKNAMENVAFRASRSPRLPMRAETHAALSA